MKLTYHQATFDLLKITPEIDDAAVQAFGELETRLEIKLPAALREWYSLQNACQHLRCNDDYVLPIEKLTLDPNAYDWIQLFSDGMLVIFENQTCALWALQLGGSDNPPVFVSNDDYDKWAMCAPTFSDFVYGRVWEWRWMLGRSSLILWDDTAFSADGLAYLREHFTEQPSGYNGFWHFAPDSTIYRFQRSDQHVQLETTPTSDMVCRVYSDNAGVLLEFLAALRPNVPYRENRSGSYKTYHVGDAPLYKGFRMEDIPF